MFARVTEYQMKPESIAAATELLHSLKERIMSMPGVHNFINVINDDGSGLVISVVESEAVSEANAPTVAEIWSQFGDHLAAPPKASGYNLIANWNN
ncbi:hypothetical protein [Roseovarius sp. D22-M7]|uniref:hypothetical protein n=1 Tax=Roseovarius sp. D22-M7 TaxID=3127116 RepID=UPI00300FCA5C